MQGHCRIQRHHFKNFIRRYRRLAALKRAHLGKQTQALVTREAIGAQANIEPQSAQSFEGKSAMREVAMTAGRMHHVEFPCRSFEQLKIAFRQLI